MRRSQWTGFLLAVFLLAAPLRAATDELICASSRDQIWFVLDARPHGKGFNLCHHADDMGGPYFKSQSWLQQAPIALAAWKNRVWVVFAPQSGSSDPRREMYTLSVQKSPMLDAYFSDPSGRLDIAPSLPGGGSLVSFAATADGPVALIVPPNEATPLQPAAATGPATAPSSGPMLLQLHNQQWDPIALPSDLKEGAALRLAAAGSDGNDLRLFASLPGSPGRSIQYMRDSQNQWVARPLELDITNLRGILNANGQALAVLSADTDNQVELAYIRPAGLVSLARVPRPANRWGFTAAGNDIQLLEQASDGKVTTRVIQPWTGRLSAATEFVAQPFTASGLWRLSMVMAFAASLLVLIFIVRPIPKKEVSLPAGFAPLPVSVRFLALLIDMAPAGILAGLILRAPMTSVFNMPLLAWNLEHTQPYLLMAGLTLLHSLASELARGTSLGKAILGARIVAADGAPVGVSQILVRNLVKAILFLIPPLALVALFNTHMRGLADLAAGTIVIHRAEPPDLPETQDR